QDVAVVVQRRAGPWRLPENPPVVEADVDRVDERPDEEQAEDGHRHRDEAVAPESLAHARTEPRLTLQRYRGVACGRHPFAPRCSAPCADARAGSMRRDV